MHFKCFSRVTESFPVESLSSPIFQKLNPKNEVGDSYHDSYKKRVRSFGPWLRIPGIQGN